MSVDLFYPDNRNRARRLQELINDTVHYQLSIKETSDLMDQKEAAILPILQELEKRDGITDFDQLFQIALKDLTEKEKEVYQKMLDEANEQKLPVSAIFGTLFNVLRKVGSFGNKAKYIELAASGALMLGVRLYAIGIRTLFTDFNEGIRIIRATSTIIKAFHELQIAGRVGKVAGFVFRSTQLLFALDCVFGVIISIVVAVQGDQQRVELQNKIRDISVYRLAMKFNQYQMRVIGRLQGEFHIYLRTVHDYGDVDFVHKIAEYLGSDMDSMEDFTYDSLYEGLKNMDSQRNSWTNEDPSKDYVLSQVSTLDD